MSRITFLQGSTDLTSLSPLPHLHKDVQLLSLAHTAAPFRKYSVLQESKVLLVSAFLCLMRVVGFGFFWLGP